MAEKKAKGKKAEKAKPKSGESRPSKGVKVRKLVDARIPYLGSASEGTVSEAEFGRLNKMTINDKPVVERRDD